MPRIGSYKPDHVSWAREILRAIFLKCREKGRLDAQHLADIADVLAQLLAPLAQDLANRTRPRRCRQRLIVCFGERRLDPLKYAHDPALALRHLRRSRR